MYFTANKKEMNVTGFGLLPSVFSDYVNLQEKRGDLYEDHFYFLTK